MWPPMLGRRNRHRYWECLAYVIANRALGLNYERNQKHE